MPRQTRAQKDLLAEGRTRFEECLDYYKDDRSLEVEDAKFAAGIDQWDKGIKQAREQGLPPRPCLTINKLAEKVDQVEGQFRSTQPQINVIGVDRDADPKIAEIFEGIIRNIEYNSDATSAYNTGFKCQVTSGRGAWRINIKDSSDDTFDKDLSIERITNPQTVFCDPFATRADRSDRRFVLVTEMITEQSFRKQYPKASLANWESGVEEIYQWRDQSRVRVAEYWYKEKEPVELFLVLRDGEKVVLREEDMDEEDRQNIQDRKMAHRDVVYWCKMSPSEILEGPRPWPGKYIPIIEVFGKEDFVADRTLIRGMIRNAKTLQMMYNYWRSTATEQVGLAPKSPYLLTPNMIAEFTDQWGDPTKNWPYLLFRPDPEMPNSAPRREPPPALSSAFSNEVAMIDHEIMASTGQYKASLGDTSQEKSGKSIVARQQQSDSGAFTFMSNFATGLTFSAKILIDLIPKVIDNERVIRIRGVDDTEALIPVNTSTASPLATSPPQFSGPITASKTGYLNDLSVGKYDVRVVLGPSFTTQREEAASTLMEFVKALPSAGNAAMDLIAENMDWPGNMKLAKRLKRMIPAGPGGIRDLESGEQPPPQQEDPELKLKMAKLEIEQEKNVLKALEIDLQQIRDESKAILNIAKAEAAEAGSQLNEYKAYVDEMKAENDARKQQEQQQQQQQQPNQPGGNPGQQ